MQYHNQRITESLSYDLTVKIQDAIEKASRYQMTAPAFKQEIQRRIDLYSEVLQLINIIPDAIKESYINGLDRGRNNDQPSRYNKEQYRAAHEFKVINRNKNLY